MMKLPGHKYWVYSLHGMVYLRALEFVKKQHYSCRLFKDIVADYTSDYLAEQEYQPKVNI